jgi:hypothetical protein
MSVNIYIIDSQTDARFFFPEHKLMLVEHNHF